MTEAARPPSPERLLQRARNGDRDAFERLTSPLETPLMTRIRLMLGRRARRESDSTDIYNEVMVRAMVGIPEFRGDADSIHVLRWLTAIARNRLRDQGRRQRIDALESMSISHHLANETTDDPLHELERSENALRLIEAVAELPDRYRQVIELRDLDQLPFNDVARIMDRSSNAVRLLHTRALVKLGKRLKLHS